MNKYILLFIFAMVVGMGTLHAQSGTLYSVAGTVMTEKGESMAGVSAYVHSNPNNGQVTDLEGRFRFSKVKRGDKIVFNFLGYEPYTYEVVGNSEKLKIVLKEAVGLLDEVVVVGRATQRKISVVGSVATVTPQELSAPSTSISNMLGGRVPGIISVTRSGEPGKDFSEFWIRGISTFGANQGALVLIDGIEGNINDINVSDIENFSVLKDASATAVYGVRGANGVVLVTTNRGKAGKLNVHFKVNRTLSESARTPNYVGANEYAALANEARLSRGLKPRYSDVELALFESGLDPDLYPNVNWRDVILKDHTYNSEYYLSASGGGQQARYFLSFSALNKDAIFNQDESANKYNTNVTYNQYSFRANVDANLTKTTVLSLDLDQVIVTNNMPGYGDAGDNQALWDAQAYLTPVTVPIKYSNGLLPAYGGNGNQISPYVLLNHTGYRERNRSSSKINAGVNQSLDFITKGLSLSGLFSFKANSYHNIYRRKMPDLYYATERGVDGKLVTQRTVEKQDASYSRTAAYDRVYHGEFKLDYNAIFGKHRVSGLAHYYMEDIKNSNAQNDIAAIPLRYQALSFRATYSYDDTYFVEGNVGYTGSENFEPGSQFGIFPAVAVGWVPTQYKFMKDNLKFINHLKIRGSIGQVGNDRISGARFPYITTIVGSNGSYWGQGGVTENQVGSDNLRWETALKYNLGVDFQMWDSKIEGTIDIFKDERSGIFQPRAVVPDEAGLVSMPWANVGTMRSSGVDGNLSYIQPINKDMSFTLRGNFTFAKNRVTNWEQANILYPYQANTGVPYGVLRGLVALGLFESQADIDSSPRQGFEKEVLPGDIKYKDINGDGQITPDDEVPLSYANTPQIQYGFAAEYRWKGFTASVFFEGTGKSNFFYGGTGYYPFVAGNAGNILDVVADQGNRWTAASISGNPATENPNARFPRLSYGNNANNNRASSFWLADAAYLRLKNVDISYRFQNSWLKRNIGIESATLSLIGTNLAVWDNVKLWDPGQASANGSVYPVQRTYSLQLNVNF